MRSLRKGLTTWLCTAVVIVGAVVLVIGNWRVHDRTQWELDYQMEQVAHILAAQDFTAQSQGGRFEDPPLNPSIHLRHDSDDDLIAVVRDAGGHIVYASKTNEFLRGGVLPATAAPGFQVLKVGKRDFRVFNAESRGLSIEIAQSMDVIREAEGRIALATLVPMALLIPVLILVIGFVIRSQLGPLDQAATTIAQRPAASFEELPVTNLPLEVRPLVEEINRLMKRLETTVAREKQFVTDAAHALRTPLTALQLQADVLDGGKTPAEKAERLAELRTGIRRVIRLSEQLLSIARTESSAGVVSQSTELQQQLQDVVQYYGAAARTGGVELDVVSRAAVSVPGTARQIGLIIGNLLDNAIRYSPPGGRVELRACIASGRARIELSDEGSGLPPQELERVFERFYRAPGDASNGSGLGLSTVDSVVRQLGGSVWLENRNDRSGLVAVVTLPIVKRLAPVVPHTELVTPP